MVKVTWTGDDGTEHSFHKPPYTKAEEEAFYRVTAPVNCRGLTFHRHPAKSAPPAARPKEK